MAFLAGNKKISFEMKIILRRLTLKDYIGVREVDEQTQRQYLGQKWDRLSKDKRESHLKSRSSEFETSANTGFSFVAIHDGKIVGFIFAYETLSFHGRLHIHHIAIHPQYQNQGIGMQLYKRLVKKAKQKDIKKIIALINLDNPASIRLHEKLGFTLKDRKEATLDL